MKKQKVLHMFGVLLGIVLIAAVSAGMVYCLYDKDWIREKRNELLSDRQRIIDGAYEEDFLEKSCALVNPIYWWLQKEQTGVGMMELFFPEYVDFGKLVEKGLTKELVYYGQEEAEYVPEERWWDTEERRLSVTAGEKEAYRAYLEKGMTEEEWRHLKESCEAKEQKFKDLLSDNRLKIYAIDTKNGTEYYSMQSVKGQFADGKPKADFFDAAEILLTLRFDAAGVPNGLALYPHGETRDLSGKLEMGSYFVNFGGYGTITPITDMTVYLYSDSEDYRYLYDTDYRWGNAYYGTYYTEEGALNDAGFGVLVAIGMAVIALGVLLLPFIKPLGIGRGITSKLPFELAVIGLVLLIPCGQGMAQFISAEYNGDLLFKEAVIPFVELTVAEIGWLNYHMTWLLWFGFFALFYVALLSLRAVFTLGIKEYALKNIWIIRIPAAGIRALKRFLKELTRVNLTESLHKKLLGVVGINFVVLLFLCSIWFAGWVGVVIYSIVLYILLKRYAETLQKDYRIVTAAAGRMAEGHLEVGIPEDTGVFEPLKEELVKVQQGMKKAVEEEMKSERMKAELITNVSHDLKTPLTAIITYVNLLKEGNLTEEERENYIAVLDQKSERLKKLIEDLFDVSKANSGTVRLDLVEVDLVELIKGVQVELEDKLMESQVELRVLCQEEKASVMADSEKTYRIFTNLFVNIAKYAMPKTRAYVEIKEEESFVFVGMKNISAAELDFDVEEITERFVRGDASRNTDGSGLGLAIVKSFMELMGGRLAIETDGDLFKVKLWFKKL